ncbi:hypothetical protein QTI66_27060 [Variovorax sp. J22R133]|uniref:hypothetical protein n=1 Tax=Variovorax brevis TaxID=3053503 RepID=UPI0025758098|nr:hypothetical protein [Variovorax sp. J22R133]MDM0115838.1 hypothetical protein [Variovorax sp. J22R133]
MAAIEADPQRGPMSFNRLGPFYRLQLRLGLLTQTDLRAPRRAVLFMVIAWIPGLVLASLEGLALNEHHERAALLDFSAYAFIIAIGAFVIMEESAARRMAMIVAQFTARGIVPPASRHGIDRARTNMERRTGSPLAEAVILIAAYVLTYLWMHGAAQNVDGGTWMGHMENGSLKLSLAGWWTLLVAMPLYWFLLGRWLLRFGTWGLLLRDIAQCDLQLVATHPDRCGGLAFIGQYPRTYVLFVFAESVVVSATVLKLVVYAGVSLASFKFALAGIVAFFAIAFMIPLLVFSPKLVALKRQGLMHYGRIASQHNLAFEAKWLNADAAKMLGEPDPSSLADLSAGYELVKNMLAVPVTKESILPILLAAITPLALVAATQVPFKEVLGTVKGLLML